MLCGDHTGNDLNKFAHAQNRPRRKICVSDKTFRCRQGLANEVLLTPPNDDFLDLVPVRLRIGFSEAHRDDKETND